MCACVSLTAVTANATAAPAGIAAGERWTLEHLVALINGGANREANLGVTCDWCLPIKNAEDVAEKSIVAKKRAKHIGAKAKPHRSFATNRNGPFRKKLDGTVEKRES